MAVEQLTASEGKALTEDRLVGYSGLPFTVTTRTPDPNDPSDLDVEAAISVPLADAMLVDVLGLADGQALSTRIVTRREY